MRLSRTSWTFISLAAALAVFIAVFIAFFNWNLLRGPIAAYLGGKLHREVIIHGDLHGEFSLKPLLTADNVTIANTAWGSEPLMGTADRVQARVDLMSLFRRPVDLPELTLTRPVLLLERAGENQENWVFGDASKNPPPRLGRLAIDDGTLRFRDPAAGTDITIKVATAGGADNGQLPTRFSGAGKLRNTDFSVRGSAAQVLALENRDQPFRMDVDVKSGATNAKFNGTVVPSRIDDIDGALALQGRDLSELHAIIGVNLPWSPPYRLKGNLRHANAVWSFHELSGKVGQSDVAGRFEVNNQNRRTLIDADLVSDSLQYKDLGGLVGLPPPNAPPQAMTPAQKKAAAERAAAGRALPIKPYNLEGLRKVDAKVHLRAKRFKATDLPLDSLDAQLDLRSGVLKLQPLDFGVGGGRVASQVTLDAREKVMKSVAEATVRNVELKQILPALKPPSGSAGKVGGRAHLNASGNSIAEMLAGVNGEMALISRGGDASAISIVLTNLDLARAGELLLRGADQKAAIHCVVADFVAQDGIMQARTLVVDTDAEKILGEGKVDFRQERYDMALKAQSKHASLLALRGPILIEGSLKKPNVHPAVGPIAGRVGASVALGIINPIAALLPLIEYGGASDADCRGLIEQSSDNVKNREAANRTDPQRPQQR